MDKDYNEATKVGRKRGEKNTHEAECLHSSFLIYRFTLVMKPYNPCDEN